MRQTTGLAGWLDRNIGLPLYYCSDCGKAAKAEKNRVTKQCGCAGLINAPRKVFLHGAGNRPPLKFKMLVKLHQFASALTGRNV